MGRGRGSVSSQRVVSQRDAGRSGYVQAHGVGEVFATVFWPVPASPEVADAGEVYDAPAVQRVAAEVGPDFRER